MTIPKSWFVTTIAAGVCDISSAFLFAGLAGHGPLVVLRGVAAGPFGDRMANSGLGAAQIGLCVHFIITGIIVGTFVALWVTCRQFARTSSR